MKQGIIGQMSDPHSAASIALPLPATAEVGSPSPSELEREVIRHFDEFRSPLLRYILSFGLSAHDGEDIIQEVFLSLFRHLRLGRSQRNLRGWIFRVAHNLSLKRRGANKRLQQLEAVWDDFVDRQVDPAPSAEQQMVLGERQVRLIAVLRALPDQDQRCLRLRAEGLRYREIAEVLDISLGAVSILLTRSLAKLERADGN